MLAWHAVKYMKSLHPMLALHAIDVWNACMKCSLPMLLNIWTACSQCSLCMPLTSEMRALNARLTCHYFRNDCMKMSVMPVVDGCYGKIDVFYPADHFKTQGCDLHYPVNTWKTISSHCSGVYSHFTVVASRRKPQLSRTPEGTQLLGMSHCHRGVDTDFLCVFLRSVYPCLRLRRRWAPKIRGIWLKGEVSTLST